MDESTKDRIKNLLSLKLLPVFLEPPRMDGQETPLRAELFSVEQMAEYARGLASWHELESARGPDRLLPRLKENAKLLLEAYQLLQAKAAKKTPLLPADEWFLDNYFLIEEQIHLSHKHLPKAYSRELPALKTGKAAGLPRVYDMAQEVIAHGDGRVDAGSLSAFVEAYQAVVTLKLGELWAIPIMLRLALIENLRRVAARITAGMLDRKLALDWSDRMIAIVKKDPKNLVLEMADLARSNPPMSSAFVAELTRQLQGQGPALALPLTWMEQRLSEDGQSIEQLVRLESQRLAEDQVSVSNSIASLRFIDAMDWREFVETQSEVERILRRDPPGVYHRADFATRDRCRHQIEFLALRTRRPEPDVAAAVLAKARSAASADERQGQVTYYLLDRGLRDLEKDLRPRFTLAEHGRRLVRRHPLFFYLGAIAALTLGGAGAVGWALRTAPGWFLGALSVPGVIALSRPALAWVNWLFNRLVKPRPLPRLDFSAGLPPEARTLVVVPCLLSDAAAVAALLENLEVLYLANRDACLHFGLVTDFDDAPVEVLPADAALLAAAQAGIRNLNARYPADTPDRFYLIHRPRRWNPSQGTWMGWERKRGKLENLNTVLQGGTPEPGTLITGEPAILRQVRFVITLDADTRLTLDSARILAATLAHPLNRPRVDCTGCRISEGYGILQPRMGTILDDARRSWLGRWFGGEEGIDPYTQAVSDTYQDLFREGSFVGKGIYDVEAFHRVLSGRLPENRILSHDLLEGGYLRSGLVSDVIVYENDPANYLADLRRRLRWVRGDWQIARWLWFTVPGLSAPVRNPLTLLYRWKIADNLRRSLEAPGVLAILLLGWLQGAWAAELTAGAFLWFFLPPVLSAVTGLLFERPKEQLFALHARDTLARLARHAARDGLRLAFLAFETVRVLGAIGRTLWRLWISRKHLLNWTQHSAVSAAAANGIWGTWRVMWAAPALAFGAALAVDRIGPGLGAGSGLWLSAWFVSPLFAWLASRSPARTGPRLASEQIRFLRRLARRTWRFFETYVQESDHWLPLDNFQEQPVMARAHRTSPTNVGLSLLANLAAYDFGYISGGQLVTRTERTLRTLGSMERFRGHFYNWYDTRTLLPLEPRYVSTVDSGNLAGHLLVLRQGLLGLAQASIMPEQLPAGRADTLAAFEEALHRPGTQFPPDLQAAIDEVRQTMSRLPEPLPAPWGRRRVLSAMCWDLAARLTDWPEAAWWMRALEVQCHDLNDEMAALAPWLEGPAEPADDFWEAGDGRTGRDALRAAWPNLTVAPTLAEIAGLERTVLPLLAALDLSRVSPERRAWLDAVKQQAQSAAKHAQERLALIETLARQCQDLSEVETDFLYDQSRRLLSIGYHVGERRRDDSYYDLLASEARLGSFVAIAQGRLPAEHWFALGRNLTLSNGRPALLSWGGSMFEYLMPQLVMPAYANTLLDQTCRAAVARQIEYAGQRQVFWGISESGYNLTDANHVYQYRAFGVPGLGYKQGLADDLVIAPYASALALLVEPQAAAENLRAMAGAGLLGPYGLYEAVDYTPARLLRGQAYARVSSYMAHHQGMVLLSLAYTLLDRPMQKRFESEPLFQAAGLLLQERVPRVLPAGPPAFETTEWRWQAGEERAALMRVFNTPHTPAPEVHLLSNGQYHVMVTQAGGGYSRWKDLALTRWREDATLDDYGLFCYIRDVARAETWSTAFHPLHKAGKHYEAIFSQARAEFRRRDLDLDTHTEIAVSPEDDIELRRVRITNRSRLPRVLELTTYAEVVLAPPAAEATHPAFNNLFVQTEIIRNRSSILCTRRPRSASEPSPWLMHLMVVQGAAEVETSFETDRARFIGRGRSTADPAALEPGPLSDTAGAVLDPVAAIRRRIVLEPEATAIVNIVLGAAESRDQALGLIEKYHDWRLTDRVFELAFSHGQVVLHQLNATESDAQAYGRLAGAVLFADAARRALPGVILKNVRGQSGLWGYGISGDLPIVLLRISDQANLDLVRSVLQMHAYWRLKGLAADLIIWNEDDSGYRQQLQDKILGLISSGLEAQAVDRPAGIFVRRTDQIPEVDQVLMLAAARVILSDAAGPLEAQITRRVQAESGAPAFTPYGKPRPQPDKTADLPARDLVFFNGLGGFTPDGKEYITTVTPQRPTPMPWANVLANPQFGSVVTESGSAYTFSENAHEFRLTPWHNDPIGDPSGEAFYLRDEESGKFWSPALFPAPGLRPYVCRHGFGYTIFEHAEHGISTEFTQYVAVDAAVKFMALKVRNTSGRLRRLSVTGYVEWVLGELRPKTFLHVKTEVDAQTNAVFARNPFNAEFAGRTAFFDVNDPKRTVTGDRAEFLGRNGSFKKPAALGRTRLSNKVGAALDPCAGLQTVFDLAENEEKEIVFILGAGRSTEDARSLVKRFRGLGPAHAALEGVWGYWNKTLGAVNLETPDPALNLLGNGWLLYQVLASRLWARSGYYQSGGAFGFRDQLQDTLALLHAEPRLVREHLLRCAAHQFPEGDVQHWWHPPQGRGVRTRCSDDYLWLPYALCRYVAGTGDVGVLAESAGFVEGRQVRPDEESYYDLPGRSEAKASLYEHGVLAIRRALRFGAHGLPLMGTGDWNDGMNRVGEQGRGESVWLGFFLSSVLTQFGLLAEQQQDAATADLCRTEAASLRLRLAQEAWDGHWWLRAFFDNGAPLGSAANDECRIDSLPQSWAILSGAGDPARNRQAMAAVERYLVKPEDGVIKLFDPPFDRTAHDPGYIRGYVPGVRENGGQYTHAGIWAAMAMAALGEGKKAWAWFDLLNPIHHAGTPEQMARYQTEPYVMAADVYSQPPHTGRGGWSWYTGSAAWMYQLILETLLGLKLEVDKLTFTPCWPENWENFKVHYRYRETVYHMAVVKSASAETKVIVDGVEQADGAVHLADDRKEHWVEYRTHSIASPPALPEDTPARP